MRKKLYKVFTKRVANALCKQGFQIVDTEINNQKPWLYVYLFEPTDEFMQALEKEIGGQDKDDQI